MILGLGVGLTKTPKQGKKFSPDSLSEVITWLKADTGVTTDSNGVARWRDNIGRTDWVSSIADRQASVSGSGVNTKITFDGGDRYYQKEYDWNTTDDPNDFDFPHDVLDVMNSGGSGGFHTFAVMEVDSSLGLTTHQIIGELARQDDGAPGSPFPLRTDIAGAVAIYTKGDYVGIEGINGGTVAFNSGTSAGAEFPLDQKFLVSVSHAGGTDSVALRVNGANKALTNGVTVTPGTMSINIIGNNITNGIKGDLYELINCNARLTQENRNLVEAYLMDRHNIS